MTTDTTAPAETPTDSDNIEGWIEVEAAPAPAENDSDMPTARDNGRRR